eukprot:scaffold115765_cov72-Phaeocystis_antarctica.AAC.3
MSLKSPTRSAPSKVWRAHGGSERLRRWPCTMSVRGDFVRSPRNQPLRSSESTGEGPASSGHPSPDEEIEPLVATAQNVACQSTIDARPCCALPRCASGSHPPPTRAIVRTPPSHRESLPPRKGALLPAGCHPPTGLPLSLAKTKRQVRHMPVERSACTTAPIVSSSRHTIADHLACKGLYAERKRFK